MSLRYWLLSWLAVGALLDGCAAQGLTSRRAGPMDAPRGPWRAQTHFIPMTDAAGHSLLLQARVCRPLAGDSARIAVIAHGSPGQLAMREKMLLLECTDETAQWFLSRGYLVVFALRRGYGVTGGTWAEDLGQCPGADFDRAGREAARDISAVVEYATALPFAQKDGAVVVGHSGGGLGTIAYGSAPHPAVGALVSMAGGRGGHWQFKPNSVCHSERLIESVRRFGRGATIPMLWVYSENDSFFDLSLARVMQQAYLEGGGQAGLQAIAPFDKDGHFVFTGKGGSQLWGPPVERYLAERQAAAQLNLSQ